MNYKLNKLLEILNLVEDDKVRMGTFINKDVFGNISDEERKKWARKASEADDEYHQLYFANRALGYDRVTALNYARHHIYKETKKIKGKGGKEQPRQESEHSVFRGHSGEKETGSGFEKASGHKTVSVERKEAITNLIDKAKTKFEKNPDAIKVLAVTLIQHGFDEIIPPAKIPFYDNIIQLIKKAEADAEVDTGAKGKRMRGKSTDFALVTDAPPNGLGITRRLYYDVMGFLKDNAKSLQHNEAFMAGLKSIFGGKPSEFKLSNLEPMIDVIKRDLNNNKFKSYGLHLQGVTKEEGEDMLKDVPSIKHQYQGDALLIPLEPKTNLKSVLKKAIPGKKVILFGFDSKPHPLRKGWEGFPYKLVNNPTVVGSYSLSTESKSESLLKLLSEGFQCQNYDHSTLSCGLNRECGWKGFAGMGEDMKRECLDFK